MTSPELLDAVPEPDAVRRVFDAVTTVLLENGRVEIGGFGVFELVHRKPRSARNPRTGARVQVPARAAIRFRPADGLKSQATTRLPQA